ncbi:MAG: 2-oxoacid:acceptor oxidoreductase subunit alpha [Acidobacteria bacterium]|nr:2-oxoacid:acceptor oxidoreductase subunit alpha [Acidobacteriota bacterium]
MGTKNPATRKQPKIEKRESATVRFVGDSGDGMQVTGGQFTISAAIFGNDLSTLPDFPAEIRAPAGTLPGVSGFQVNFSAHDIRTPGDNPDILVAMNPAALKMNLADLEPGGILITNRDAFTPDNLRKARYQVDPHLDDSLSSYRLFDLPLTSLTVNAVQEANLKKREAERCKNFFALGVLFWIFDRSLEHTRKWIDTKFAKRPEIAKANRLALQAGYNYADTTEIFTSHYRVEKANLPRGKYRNVTGNQATALGFLAASHLANRPLFYASYPITPASDILHELANFKQFGVKTFQTEDEIAAMGAAIGAAFGGSLGLTGTSGPGLCLKSEAMGLAVMTELPVVIANVQRCGPSTGMPTKTEQSDLLQAFFGRNGECPVAIVAPATPTDCFQMAIEAFRIAVRHMTPVIYLSDGYLANGSEPWKIPAVDDLPRFPVEFRREGNGYQPYARDPKSLARAWVIPGTPGMEHRIGGLEKQDLTGEVSYDPENHERMVQLRAEKVARIANDIPPAEVFGAPEGDLLLVGWGGTYGAITSAVEEARKEGASVSSVHIRYLNPFPPNLGKILSRFKRILVPELNLGQLLLLIRAKFAIDAEGFSKVQGKPFGIGEIKKKIQECLP